MERMEKKEREQNNLAEGTHSRTEQNHLKKSRNVPSPKYGIIALTFLK